MTGYRTTAAAIVLAATLAQSCLRSQSAEVEFRAHARRLYHDLRTPSCADVARGFDRFAMLSGEQASVSAFERRIERTPLHFHLEVARADAAYELSIGGCWADSDVRFANMHVEMTRKSVKAYLERMNTLVASAAPFRRVAPAAQGAKFRFHVRELQEAIHPRCRISNTTENQEIVLPARLEAQRFRNRLRGSPYALHWDIAEADSAYLRSISIVECAAPDDAPAATLRQARLAHVKRTIGILEATMD